MTFEIGDDVIYIRDILERIEELENEDSRSQDEEEEFLKLSSFVEEATQYCSDFEYSTTIIHENYFEEYQDKLIEDCYDLPKDLPYWMSITYDYDALKQDYVEIDLDGHTYLVYAY